MDLPSPTLVSLDDIKSSSTALTNAINGSPAFFSHKAYSPVPEVFYTTSAAEAEVYLSRLQGDVIGLKIQWDYEGEWNVKNQFEGVVGRTALIQVCDGHTAVLYHIKYDKSEYLCVYISTAALEAHQHTDFILPRRLVTLLQDEKVYKCGVQVRGEPFSPPVEMK